MGILDVPTVILAPPGVAGLHRNPDSPTYGAWYTFGTTPGSMGFAGTGTPAEAYAPFVVYQRYGDWQGGSNAPVRKTTQGTAFVTNYYGPAVDDSAQGTGFVTLLKNTGTPFTQTKQLAGIESTNFIEGGNVLNEQSTCYGARFVLSGTGHADTVSMFRSGQIINTGTIGTFHAFKQDQSPPNVTGPKYGLYAIDQVVSETAFILGRSGASATFQARLDGGTDQAVSMLLVKGPDALSTDPGPHGLTGISIVQAANQTRSLFEARDTGGTTRFQISAVGAVNMAQQFAMNTGGVVQITLSPTSGITLNDGINLALGTVTGTKIGTAAGQKLGFFGAAPVAQPAQTLGIKASLVALGLISSVTAATPLNLDGGALTAGTGSFGGDVAMGGHRVTGLADPAAAQDAATRAYVQAQIAALINGAPGTLDTLKEIADQLASDETAAAALATSLATETTNRTTADTTLQTNITTEATARAAADTVLDGRVTTNTTNITANATAIANEITRATAAEAANTTAIGNEAVTRANADTTLQTNITAETTRATAAEATLVPKSIADALGDLLIGTANDIVGRLAVGSDGQRLEADSTAAGGLRWVTIYPDFPANFAGVQQDTGAVSVATANEAKYSRVIGHGTISKLRIHVGTSSGNVCAAVYTATGVGVNRVPAARSQTTGSIPCPAAGSVDLALGASVTVREGDFLAFSCDNVTATFSAFSGTTGSTWGGTAYMQSSAFPLPSSAGTLTASPSRIPRMVGVT